MSTEAASEGRRLLSQLAKHAYSATNGQQEPLTHLETVQHLGWLLDHAREKLVEGARVEGADWGQIGRALGVTRQAARKRYGVTSDPEPAGEQPQLWPFAPTTTPEIDS